MLGPVLSSKILVVMASRTARRAARERRRQLERELAAYSTPSDLEAILDRYPAGQTHELHSILSGQQMARAVRPAAPPVTRLDRQSP